MTTPVDHTECGRKQIPKDWTNRDLANALAFTTPTPQKNHSLGSSYVAIPIIPYHTILSNTRPVENHNILLLSTISRTGRITYMRMCCRGYRIRERSERPPNQPLLNTRNKKDNTEEPVLFLLVSLKWCPCSLKERDLAHGTHRSFHRRLGLGGIRSRVWGCLKQLSLISV